MSELKDLVLAQRRKVLTSESQRLTKEATELAQKRAKIGNDFTALSARHYQYHLQSNNRDLASKISQAVPGIEFQDNEIIGSIPVDLDAFIRLSTPKELAQETVEDIVQFLTNLTKMLTTTVADILRLDPKEQPSKIAQDLVRIDGDGSHGVDLGNDLTLKVRTEDSNDPLAVELETMSGSIKLATSHTPHGLTNYSNLYLLKLRADQSQVRLDIEEDFVNPGLSQVYYGDHSIESSRIDPGALVIPSELKKDGRQAYDATWDAAHTTVEA
jgi:hypothetical protein